MSQLAEQQNTAISVAPTPAQMLAVAVEKGADLDKMEKLMDLQERWEAKEAKKAFTQALAKFQSKLGPIIKKQKVDYTTSKGRTQFSFADIDDIAQAIRPIMEECGLSYRFEQHEDDKSIKISCIVSHVDGFSAITSMSAGHDNTGGKNAIQAAASTVTYLRRYTLTGALGITTGQDDNDGGKPAVAVEELLEFMSVLRDEFFSIHAIKESLINNDYSTAKEAWNELDENARRVLWRAPTKGGILTTEERAKMHSSEWSQAE